MDLAALEPWSGFVRQAVLCIVSARGELPHMPRPVRFGACGAERRAQRLGMLVWQPVAWLEDWAGSSVEIDGRAGDIGGAIRQEIGRQVGELLRPAYSAQRDAGVLGHLAVELVLGLACCLSAPPPLAA